MKTFVRIIAALAALFTFPVRAQNINWSKALGGSFQDDVTCIQQTTDGGYVFTGCTNSNDGDVAGNHGDSDAWVVKLDTAGTISWQKCLGGSAYDCAYSIQQTFDGGYVIAGWTLSNDGEVSGNHGFQDVWVIKLDPSGNITWQKCFGGSYTDGANSILQTFDSGYIVAGFTLSADGDVSGTHGSSDIWVIKLDPSGNLVWQKCLGGTGSEGSVRIRQTGDGGYVLAGSTDSNDGDVTGNHGKSDFWVVKLDSSGNITRQKCFGGSESDEAYDLEQTQDGYIATGLTFSNDGNVSGNHGWSDVWVVKLDTAFNFEWQKCLGGSSTDDARSIQTTFDSGFILGGYASSNDGDVSGNHPGISDAWIVKLDSFGNMIWQKCYGGTNQDFAHSVCQTSDSGYVFGAYISSADGDVTGFHGGYCDAWIVKLNGQVREPVFTPPTGASYFPISFSITSDPGTTIHYTSDGSTPDCYSDPSGSGPVYLTTPDMPGTYQYNAISCKEGWTHSEISSGIYTVVPTGIDDALTGKTNVHFAFPNPAHDFINVYYPDNSTDLYISLVNFTGTTICREKQIQETMTIDLSGYPQGIYILRISGTHIETGKVFTRSERLVIGH